MSNAVVIPLSRYFAAGLCLRGGSLTSLDLCLWLAAVSGTLALVDEPDESGLTMRDHWMTAHGDAAPVWIAGPVLLQATGQRGYALLERSFERLAEARVSIGLHGPADAHRLWHGWEATPVSKEDPIDRGVVSGLMLTQAMIEGDPHPVAVNLSAMAAFRSRFSALIYLRALGWMAGAGTPKSWSRTRPGPRVSVTVPIGDLHRALGTDSLAMVGDWNAKAFGPGGRGGPVHEDLATAGIRLKTEWRMGAAGYGTRQVPTGLRITVSTIAGAERRPLPRRPRQSSSSSISASSRP